MTQPLLYLSAPGESAAETPWWLHAMRERHYGVVAVDSIEGARDFAGRHTPRGIVIDCEGPAEAARARVAEAAALAAEHGAPLIGWGNAPGAEGLRALAEAGLAAMITPDQPLAFLLGYLDGADARRRMKRLQDDGESQASLAAENRKVLHSLAQPLSALQGRLQLLHMKCGEDDPVRATYRNLVELVMDVTRHLRELQELQRKHD